MSDPFEILRAVRQLGDSLSEEDRQALGRAAFAEAMGIPSLADLIPCDICGKLDDDTPCGDCLEVVT